MRLSLRIWAHLRLGLACLALWGCASVTIHPGEQPSHLYHTTKTAPDFEQSVPFSWFGLAGTHRFDVRQVCRGEKAIKIKSLHTLSDLMIGLKTGFFKLPKTAQIWCQTPRHRQDHKDNNHSNVSQKPKIPAR